jgi:hypothetical protein
MNKVFLIIFLALLVIGYFLYQRYGVIKWETTSSAQAGSSRVGEYNTSERYTDVDTITYPDFSVHYQGTYRQGQGNWLTTVFVISANGKTQRISSGGQDFSSASEFSVNGKQFTLLLIEDQVLISAK